MIGGWTEEGRAGDRTLSNSVREARLPGCRVGRAFAPALLPAITPAELEARFKQLPTVPEDKMPALSNTPGTFRGLIQHEGLEGGTWVAFPFFENPGSFRFDPQGRLYVAEANRFWLGVPDLRGARRRRMPRS